MKMQTPDKIAFEALESFAQEHERKAREALDSPASYTGHGFHLAVADYARIFAEENYKTETADVSPGVDVNIYYKE